MKNRKQSFIAYPKDNLSVTNLSKKISALIDDAIPDTLMGMLVTAKECEGSIVFYERWELIVKDKCDYDIYDNRAGEVVYNQIALFSNAVKMIYYLNKKVTTACPLDKTFYELDQEYYRCWHDLNMYKKKVKEIKDNDLKELFSLRMLDSQCRLQEIKMRLSKLD
jgi:hypothetical protein